jgi:hypothetical protein
MTVFERLNLSIQAEVVVSIDGLHVQEKKNQHVHCWGIYGSVFMDIGYWETIFVLEVNYISINVCKSNYLVGPTKVNFRMLASLSNGFLGL